MDDEPQTGVLTGGGVEEHWTVSILDWTILSLKFYSLILNLVF